MSGSIQQIFNSAILQFLNTHQGDMTVSELIAVLQTEVPSDTVVVAEATEMVQTEKKTKKKKKKKDPNAPKKALSAYLFFCKTTRPQLKAEGVTGKAVMVKLGEMWKESTLDKSPFTEMGRVDKERYAKEMEAYTPPESSASEDN